MEIVTLQTKNQKDMYMYECFILYAHIYMYVYVYAYVYIENFYNREHDRPLGPPSVTPLGENPPDRGRETEINIL